MASLTKKRVANGIFWVECAEADLRVLCGCPSDAVKLLACRGFIGPIECDGVDLETGPNTVLLSDILLQNGGFANLAEFPVLQMLYRQGMILPDHPGNTGRKPLLIGSEAQVKAQLEYIYRGNYGLDSANELMAAGVTRDTATEMMRIKQRFAFGKILPTEELLDSLTVGPEPVEIRNGVSIRRTAMNVFEFAFRDEKVTVDLSLGPSERYEVPYPLGFHQIERDYFSVIHLGDGDGWDVRRPTMGSIVMFQGKLYLIDAGPNLLYRLRFLGIGVSEIVGIFHTHCHDDHFSGLATLMRSDHRLKYYATPMVRASVSKKLAALVGIDEEDFASFFDIQDLTRDRWNDIEGLQVKPVYSPHPVDTTIMTFRAMSDSGFRTYAHLADTVSLDVLKEMVTEDASVPGVSPELFERVCREYAVKVDVKKVDVGGGMIHGVATDFRDDPSDKIILAHTSSELSDEQKEIGSGAPFGSIDVLIPAHHDYIRRDAFRYLRCYFPDAPEYELEILVNNPIRTFNPETILLKAGEKPQYLYLILTGNVEKIQTSLDLNTLLDAGAFVGSSYALTETASERTYRAASFVNALQIPCRTYLDAVKRNGLYDELANLSEKRNFLQQTWLFGGNVSYPVHNRLAQAMQKRTISKGHYVQMDGRAGVSLVDDGQLELLLDTNVLEEVTSGQFVGEHTVLINASGLFRARAAVRTTVFFLPAYVLRDIPAVRWKLLEVQCKRMRMILDPELVAGPIFQWRKEFETGVPKMDTHHRKLFEMAADLHQHTQAGAGKSDQNAALEALIDYARSHFDAEEELMRQHEFTGYEPHRRKHLGLIQSVRALQVRFANGELKLEAAFLPFFKDWIVDHILTEDRKYSRQLAGLTTRL